ncbi:MAG TPA: 1,3-beta-galactosyl-N-acetylhexosamine phosphorylase N-terminal domain-containing protein, partial [Tissierellaceae bacterium]|nr:1,3-beta-galactosyl-N-acetylhexosamine phosphorylase N-terminal domain-containing protein [Tissierellaceae bacterium]
MTKKDLKGRLTLPSEENFYKETLEMLKKLKADAIRDSDGTKLPDEIKDIEDALIYTTYFTVRDINDFAKDNMEEAIRLYLSSEFKTATDTSLTIDLMEDYFDE